MYFFESGKGDSVPELAFSNGEKNKGQSKATEISRVSGKRTLRKEVLLCGQVLW